MISAQHERRLQSALDLIEHAQRTILSAAQQLSPVPGFAHEWTATCRLYDTVKAQWHNIALQRQARREK